MNLKFWKKKINVIKWNKKPKQIFEWQNINHPVWFKDGKTNITYNCLEKNLKSNPKKIAIHFVDRYLNIDSINYKTLSDYTNFFSSKILNIKNFSNKNQRCMIHASASKTSAISMLSCNKLGIFHSVIFEELDLRAIKLRLTLLKPNIFISRNTDFKFIYNIDKEMKKINNKNYKIFIFGKKKKIKIKNLEFIDLDDVDFNKIQKVKYKFVKSDNPSFCLFTSGSTGIPKGIIHSTGGYLIYAKLTCKKKFGMNENTTVLTASDAGWINGHTYALYGPLSLGSTVVMMEKPFSLINKDFFEKIILNLKINIVYLPVTLIKILRSLRFSFKKKKYFKIKSIGSMGEPLSPDVCKWYINLFFKHRKPVINTYFQTETGGIISSPSYSDKRIPHGSVGSPMYKNLNFTQSINGKKSELLVKKSWPGCMIDVINGEEVWKKYWTKFNEFRLFDLGTIDKDKNFFIHGRIDDVINIRGHRVGSEEFESVVLKSKDVVECCAVSIPDKIEGEKFLLVLVLRRKNIIPIKDIEKLIFQYFGEFAIPKKIIVVSELPKTRSGKILRRIIRKIIQGDFNPKIDDISTLLNPKSINELIKKVKK